MIFTKNKNTVRTTEKTFQEDKGKPADKDASHS